MSRTASLYVLRLYLWCFAAMFLTVLAVFLVADFSDRVKLFLAHPLGDVALMYWNKALLAMRQLAPPSMMLAAGAAIATLHKRGELTALRALSFGPAALYLPIGGAAVAGALLLFAFDETVVTGAGAAVDELAVSRFNAGWGDWYSYYRPTQWYRHGNQVLHVGARGPDEAFTEVSLFELSSDFRISSRIDAERMTHLSGPRWQLEDAVVRRFLPNGAQHVERLPKTDVGLLFNAGALGLKPGRPEYLPFFTLRDQIRARRQVGQPTEKHLLALHNRFAYPLTGLAATLLAIGLALRPGQRGHLTRALVEGFVVTVAMWAMMVVGKGMALAGHLPVAAAAWVPCALLAAAALALGVRRMGLLGSAG